jgi:hypothetical protein
VVNSGFSKSLVLLRKFFNFPAGQSFNSFAKNDRSVVSSLFPSLLSSFLRSYSPIVFNTSSIGFHSLLSGLGCTVCVLFGGERGSSVCVLGLLRFSCFRASLFYSLLGHCCWGYRYEYNTTVTVIQVHAGCAAGCVGPTFWSAF